MRNYGFAALCDFLGDLVVYRNLVPADPRLPPLAEVRPQLGLRDGTIPRKSAPEYARVIVALLRQARALDMPDTSIERLVYVGDTRLNDGNAFINICRAGQWPGLAFIASEGKGRTTAELVHQTEGTLYLANRWAALEDFVRFCHEQRFPLDEQTAVIIDIDKTALGARGRNDHVIDQARVEALYRTTRDLLGDGFDSDRFQAAYNRLNQPEFHPFTADNQDYLAYTCLILGSGLYLLEALVKEIRSGRLATFQHFIADVDQRAAELPPGLLNIHRQIYSRVLQGDPTPFKAFRYNEYQATVERMGKLDNEATATDLLREEIVITQEVRETALAWREQGALLFGLSDKPDEASIPTERLASQGYQPIHRTKTHVVGD